VLSMRLITASRRRATSLAENSSLSEFLPMPDQPDVPLLLPEHYTIFGTIIQGFAEIEHMLQIGAAYLSKAKFGAVVLMMVGLGYAQKRDAFLALLRYAELPDDQTQQLRCILGEIHKHSAVRNWISHSIWVEGVRPGSFKPMQMKIRSGEQQALGVDEDERDFTLDDLRKIATDLITRKNELIGFFVAVGYLREGDIAVNMRHSNSDTSSSPGTPSAK
jgi:hypothetical protein